MKSELKKRIMTSIIYGSLFFGSYMFLPSVFAFLLIFIYLFIIVFELPKFFKPSSTKFWLTLFFYPTVPFIAIFYIFFNYYDMNKFVPIYPFIIAWTYDIGAYFCGKLFGKHKICPNISPKKTWEGFFGGILCVCVLNLELFLYGSSIPFNLIASILFSVLAFFGDLFESFLKRKASIKDSGNILPGHGGLLDRFDSVFFIAIFIALFLIVGNYQAKILWKQIYETH